MMNPSAEHPVRATDGAAGYDLYTPIAVDLGPYSQKLIPLGLAISVPQGHYGRLADRSSLAKLSIHILGGVIDSDYRGELKITVANLSNRQQSFLAGDRVAQLILERHSTPDIQEVPELPSTERGSQGFGSTGRNELTVAADQPVINKIETNSHKHTPILQFIGVLLSLLSQCSAAGDWRCSQSQTSAVGDSLHPQGISVSRIDAVGDPLRGEVSPRLDTVGDSLSGDAPLGCDTVGDLLCGDSTPRTDSVGDSSNRDTALLLSAVGDPLASGSGDLAGALLLTIGALMCRRSCQPLYSTVHSIPFSCTQASDRIAEVALRDLSQTGGPNSAGHSPESAWAPDHFMAGWGYPRCTDYRAGKVPNIVPDVAYRYEDGLTSLNLLSQEEDVTSVFARLVHRQERNTRRVSINPNIIQEFSAWMTRTGMPITVEAYACNQVADFPRTWRVKTPPPQSAMAF